MHGPDLDSGYQLAGRYVAFAGRLGGANRKQAARIVRSFGGSCVEATDPRCDLVVIGANELPINDLEELIPLPVRHAEAEGRLEVIGETQLWQLIGLLDPEGFVRRLYTPAMLADLLGVSLSVIRRWHRRGLITPVREVLRLPYFDFQEVASARRLAQLLAAGASPKAIESKLEQLARYLPGVQRPLAQLSVIVEGQQLLLRQGAGLVEPGGQKRFDFAAAEQEPTPTASRLANESEPAILSLPPIEDQPFDFTPQELVEGALDLEDEGRLCEAAEMYRTALVIGGPKAEINFQLAELLYRSGDLTAARERYYMSIELDDDFVEARASLGCVLAELGELQLAVAAFEGALHYHDRYPDVHYHLARTLDDLNRYSTADYHWRTFLQMTPDGPWAEEARDRLGLDAIMERTADE